MQTILTPALKFEIKELIDERIREKHVTKEDFTELKDIVKEIAKEQKELAQAQKETKSEMKELAQAQRETQEEVKGLANAMKETQEEVKGLANAMKETQEEVKELANTMKETQEEVKGLARAQKETQEELKALSVEVKELAVGLNYTRKDLGGLTQTFGYMLENEAYRVLPGILKDRYGIEVKERFLRRSIRSFGLMEEGEINIFSHGLHQDKGTKVVIIGEAKSQLGKDDIDDFLNTVARLKRIGKGERFLLAVTHYARETVIKYAKEKGVEVIQSFEW